MAGRARQTGATVYVETIEAYADRAGRDFDVVVMDSVIEHVYDPNALVEAASRLTKRGALLRIEAPCEPNLLVSVGNTLNRLGGKDVVYNLSPTWSPYHVFGFNPRALRVLLEKHGFALEHVSRWAHPVIPSTKSVRDRVRTLVAGQINRVANLTGTASNMIAWATRR
jgi:hypothetical protein